EVRTSLLKPVRHAIAYCCLSTTCSGRRMLSAGRSKYIDEHEQAQPDHVNEVPVPGDRFKTEMVVGAEMSLETAQQNHGQHDRTQSHMQTVKTGQHEEGRSIYART